MIHLDTNFLIQAMLSGTAEDRQLRQWLAASDRVNVSAIVWAEFLCGPLDASDATTAATLFPRPEPFLAEDAQVAATLFNQTGRHRGSFTDCMIAATAIRLNAGFRTNNLADFRPFEPSGLVLVAIR